MSEIRATTISDETGNGPIALTKQSAAKAFINYTESGSFSVAKSFNVASEVDNGNGDISYTLTSAMSDANYITSGEAGGNLSTFYSRITTHIGSTSTVVRMRSTNSSAYTTQVVFRACSAIFGDLA